MIVKGGFVHVAFALIKRITIGSNVTLYVQKRYAIIYPNFRIVVKMHKKQRKKCTKLTKN